MFRQRLKKLSLVLWSKLSGLNRFYLRLVRKRYSAGSSGERKACRFLRNLSYEILAKNWRCKLGEIDIVAGDKETLVIVEVKTRNKAIAEHFSPLEAVDPKKQDKLRRLARVYSDRHRNLLKYKGIRSLRYDIMAITYSRKVRGLYCQFSVEHIRNAFPDG